MAFRAVLNPPKPVDAAAVGGGSLIAKALTVVVVPIHLGGQTKLAQIADALDPISRSSGSCECGQQQARENPEDSDDQEQLNKSETRESRRRGQLSVPCELRRLRRKFRLNCGGKTSWTKAARVCNRESGKRRQVRAPAPEIAGFGAARKFCPTAGA